MSTEANAIGLSREEMAAVMRQVMSGEASDAQIGALLVALRMKGETIEEIAGAAEVVFVEQGSDHLRVLRENAALLDGIASVEVRRGDATRAPPFQFSVRTPMADECDSSAGADPPPHLPSRATKPTGWGNAWWPWRGGGVGGRPRVILYDPWYYVFS